MTIARIGSSPMGRDRPDKSGVSRMAARPQKMPMTPMKTMRPFCAPNLKIGGITSAEDSREIVASTASWSVKSAGQNAPFRQSRITAAMADSRKMVPPQIRLMMYFPQTYCRRVTGRVSQ